MRFHSQRSTVPDEALQLIRGFQCDWSFLLYDLLIIALSTNILRRQLHLVLNYCGEAVWPSLRSTTDLMDQASIVQGQ